MSEKFDPYYEWSGIPASEQPPHHYRLLGIPPFEEPDGHRERRKSADGPSADVPDRQSMLPNHNGC